MRIVEQEYISLKKLSIKYDLHPDTIRKKDLIEGVHFVKIDKIVRYHIKNMHTYLTGGSNIETNYSLDRFLID